MEAYGHYKQPQISKQKWVDMSPLWIELVELRNFLESYTGFYCKGMNYLADVFTLKS